MKNLYIFLLPGIFVAVLLTGSCKKVVYPPIERPENVSYSEDVQAIFNDKCIDCHIGGPSPELSPDASYGALINGGYINTNNPPESELIKTLYTSPHDARAIEAEKLTILVWIEEGAKNN